jgi:type IX secretion system PorP/SprF family membrane protein
MRKTVLLCLLIFGLLPQLKAQQNAQFTQYMYNTITINPAYAGSRGVLSIIGVHRNQWAGLDGAPTTQTLSINTPLRDDRIGLGLSFVSDKVGYERTNYLYADFSYSIKLNEKLTASFGLKAGASYFDLDDILLEDPAVSKDPYFAQRLKSWTPNIGSGIYIHSDQWFLGFSAPKMLNNDNNKAEEFQTLEQLHYYLIGGYVFDIANNVKFKPTALAKFTKGSPVSADFTATFLFYDKLWLGGAWRVKDAVGAIADFQVSKQFRVGYAYEYPISDINLFSKATHELLLLFEFNFVNNKMKSPRYF